jgi:putative FmdB family regulatory protein
MPVYMYRREDGTTFEYRQKFADDPLTVDPVSGQPVKRVVQAAGIVFKGSGFYVNDSKDASRKSINAPAKNGTTDTPAATPAATTDTAPAKEAAPAARTEAAAD